MKIISLFNSSMVQLFRTDACNAVCECLAHSWFDRTWRRRGRCSRCCWPRGWPRYGCEGWCCGARCRGRPGTATCPPPSDPSGSRYRLQGYTRKLCDFERTYLANTYQYIPNYQLISLHIVY